MSRNVRSGKGDNRTTDAGQEKTGELQGPTGFPQEDKRFETNDSVLEALDSALWWLWGRHDGWLRVVPSFSDHSLYMKWKFTSGLHAGHYVMARVDISQFRWGVQLLVGKLHNVDAGLSRPTLDTAF